MTAMDFIDNSFKMYNGIGLQTARGSGTSGYIQKNLSYNLKKPQTKEEFLKELEQKRNNNTPTPRKANPQIIDHERKRQILIQTIKLKKKLEEEGLPEEQINERIKKAEAVLKEKLQKGELQTKNKDSHIMTEAKQRQFAKVSKAFGLSQNQKHGSAFNFEEQRQQRMKKLEEKRKKNSFKCHYEGCEKIYDNEERLKRHIGNKHNEKKELPQK